jgi:TetR/AcrR family transcriptional repressor of bet genes
VARHLGVHIDGIWVRAGLLPHPVETNMAISEMQFAIEKMLPMDEISATKHKEARKKIRAVADIALGSKAFKEKFLRV